MNTEKTSISPKEARRRINDLEDPFWLGVGYANVERGTIMPDGKPETDGEHAINLAIIATAYALEYHPELDPYKVFFYCVMHDIDEFLHGDTPTLGATAETFKQKDIEEAEGAMERSRLLKNFPKFNKMIDELSDLAVPENAFGKAFDKVAPGYTHSSNHGQVLIEKYQIFSMEDLRRAAGATDMKMRTYAEAFVDVLALREEMHHRVIEDLPERPFWVDEPLFEL